MMAFRSASSIAPQRAISCSVRPQPMHWPVIPLTAQVLMHGVEIGVGCMVWLAKRLKSGVQIGSPTQRIVFQ